MTGRNDPPFVGRNKFVTKSDRRKLSGCWNPKVISINQSSIAAWLAFDGQPSVQKNTDRF